MPKQQAPRNQASIKDFFNTSASKKAQEANAINRSRPKSFFYSRIKDRLAESNELVDETPNSQSEHHEELIIHNSPLEEATSTPSQGKLQVHISNSTF